MECFVMIVATISNLFSQTQNHIFLELNFKELKHFKHCIKLFKF